VSHQGVLSSLSGPLVLVSLVSLVLGSLISLVSLVAGLVAGLATVTDRSLPYPVATALQSTCYSGQTAL
jgi:hypothetical protein